MNKGFILVLLLSFSLSAYAQDEKVPLHSILDRLEQQYQVTFTYVDKNIEGVFVSAPPKGSSLESAIQFLENQTGLVFRQLNTRFITISIGKPEKVDICGILVDIATGEVIVGATIQAGNAFAISDDTGKFTLRELSSADTVLIRHLGYAAVNAPVRSLSVNPCPQLYLKQVITTLNEIVVSNYITEGITKKTDGSFTIHTEDLGILPGLTEPDVLQTLQALPGIQSINETVSDINVRGGTNDQNLILWNGIRMYQSGHFFGLISAFNPYLVKEANLIKNGTSASLGEGVSSTIDIHTDNDVTREFAGGAGINLINADVFAKVPLSDNTSIEIGGRRSIADVLKTATYRQYFERTFSNTEVVNASNDEVFGADEDFYFYDASVKVTSKVTENDQLRFNFLSINNKIAYEESAVIDGRAAFKTSSLRQRSLASNLVYERLWNDKVKTSAQAYLSSYGLKAINFDVLNDQRLIQENEILDVGFKLDSRVSLSGNVDILTGYQLSEIGVGNLEDINKPVFRRYIKEVVQTHSLFAEATFSSNSGNTNLRSGVRANYFEKFDKIRLEPRLAISQKIIPHLSVEVLGELKSQVTTQIIDLQTDFLGVEKRRWVLVNDQDVPLIRSKQVSLGLQYNRPKFLISVDGYYKKVDGIISSSQGFQNQYQLVRSTGAYDAIGFDFIVNKKFKMLNIWLSYSYAQNTFGFKNFTPPEFPNNLDVRHSATLGSTYQTGRFQFSAGANTHTGKPYTRPRVPEQIKDNQVIYDSPNSYRLDDYMRIDCSARYNFRLGREVEAQVGGGIWNILDKKNVVNAYYQVGDSGTVREIDQKSLGITPNIFVRVSF